VRPAAPVNPNVKMAVNVSAYQFISSFLVIVAISIFELPLSSGFRSSGVMRIELAKNGNRQ
jgi:hypothetical protein